MERIHVDSNQIALANAFHTGKRGTKRKEYSLVLARQHKPTHFVQVEEEKNGKNASRPDK